MYALTPSGYNHHYIILSTWQLSNISLYFSRLPLIYWWGYCNLSICLHNDKTLSYSVQSAYAIMLFKVWLDLECAILKCSLLWFQLSHHSGSNRPPPPLPERNYGTGRDKQQHRKPLPVPRGTQDAYMSLLSNQVSKDIACAKKLSSSTVTRFSSGKGCAFSLRALKIDENLWTLQFSQTKFHQHNLPGDSGCLGTFLLL